MKREYRSYRLEIRGDKHILILEKTIKAANDINALIGARKIVRTLGDRSNILSITLDRWDVVGINRGDFSLSRTASFIKGAHIGNRWPYPDEWSEALKKSV